MTRSEPNTRKRTDPRPAYTQLDKDTGGASHVYRTADETIHAVQDGKRTEEFVLGLRTIDDYVTFVRDNVEGLDGETRRYIADAEDPFAALADEVARGVAV
jgi:hypothetical protein